VRTLIGIQAVEISRAADATAALVQNVSINHRRPNVTVTKEFLCRADIMARLDQMGCERVTAETRRRSFPKHRAAILISLAFANLQHIVRIDIHRPVRFLRRL
jgi:hypothetical protein